jgi:hypothetical protein
MTNKFYSFKSNQLSVFIKRLGRSDYWLIILLWLIATGLNINKPYHIDDTFHLKAAHWIAENPLHPMSGMIDWGDHPEPIHIANQPPLYFYMVALWGTIFGYHEVAMHLLQSIFTLLALIYFYKVVLLIDAHQKRFLLVLFAFCPVFLVNQNLMTDIPLLAVELVFIYYLLDRKSRSDFKRFLLSTIFFSIMLLIKYTCLPLVIVFLSAIVIEKKYRYLGLLILPIAIVGIWSATNYIEYGGAHILDRPLNTFNGIHLFRSIIFFIICLGAITPFSVAFIGRTKRFKNIPAIISGTMVLFCIFIIFSFFNIISFSISTTILSSLFFINGCFLISKIVYEADRANDLESERTDRDKIIILLSIWILGTSLFVILLAPFMATRHLLLIIPPVLLVGSRLMENSNKLIRTEALAFTIVLGTLLGLSDWIYADFYRRNAKDIVLPSDSQIWSAGHWGWQWYTEKRGLLQYNNITSEIRTDDYLIYPVGIPRQQFAENIALTPVYKIWEKANIFTFFSVSNSASMYYSTASSPPWRFSKAPLDTIIIAKIKLVDPNSTHIH